ncbi:MNIO family bufferin maturase [Azohydromonas caseinilytica]|uniref:UPF0276 protein HHL10_10615 n=1 Tax=Azohydromonas caseinilytica TaxID=2728836 RepID=A0A848F7U6_9BURK|nr:DUF692 domain-containing protein [Azohydromonas caseinilytica]NML15432.1 DUF692 domain-containing protein [Azohydromonas caseinilytica]
MHAVSPSLPPRCTGIGLRAEHHAALPQVQSLPGFVEVHSENYFGRGGPPLHWLRRAREHCALSLHGVALSIGSADPLRRDHLRRLRELIDELQPALVSEHLSWSGVDGVYANDLLPLPHTREALAHVVARVQQVQDALGRQLLLENLSSYLRFDADEMPEWDFVAEVARRSGCGLLLDVNNLYVGARNHGFDPIEYLDALPASAVQEIHLAGFTHRRFDDGSEILIDTHSRHVSEAVWALYREALRRLGPRPTLIEWDADIPPLSTLLDEAARAAALMEATDACPA